MLPSSPGAVQVKVMLVCPSFDTAKLDTVEGAVVSAAADVVPLGILEIAEVLGTSSEVFNAKK